MFDFSELFQQVPLVTLVPSWFYIFSGLIYLVVGIISFSVSIFSFKLFRISSSKSQLFLSLSFLLIGLSFIILSGSSFYTYQNSSISYNSLLNLNDNAYNIYYLLSLVAYLFLVIINLPKAKSEKYFSFIPLWFINSQGFHVAALLLLLYVAARSVWNFFKVQ